MSVGEHINRSALFFCGALLVPFGLGTAHGRLPGDSFPGLIHGSTALLLLWDISLIWR